MCSVSTTQGCALSEPPCLSWLEKENLWKVVLAIGPTLTELEPFQLYITKLLVPACSVNTYVSVLQHLETELNCLA